MDNQHNRLRLVEECTVSDVYTSEELAVWPVQVSGRDMPVDRARLRATVEALEKAEAQVWCLSGGCMDADCGDCRQCLKARAEKAEARVKELEARVADLWASLVRHRKCVAECLAIADAAGVHRHTPQESMGQLAEELAHEKKVSAELVQGLLARVKELEATVEAQKAVFADAMRRGDAHDTIRELLAPLGIGPHDDVVQSVRELMVRALPADTVRQVREALASIASRPCYCRTGWSGPCGCSDGMREIAEEVLELLKEDK